MYQKEHNIGRKEEHKTSSLCASYHRIKIGKLQLKQSNKQTNKLSLNYQSKESQCHYCLVQSDNIECDKYLSPNGCVIFN